MNKDSLQIRPANGHSLWDVGELGLQETGLADSTRQSKLWVEWNGRIWLRKQKEFTICEVIGYQIAEAIKLPIQPWIALYDLTKQEHKAPRNSNDGIRGLRQAEVQTPFTTGSMGNSAWSFGRCRKPAF